MSKRIKVRPRRVFLGVWLAWVVVLAVASGLAVAYACNALGYSPRVGWLTALIVAAPLSVLAGLRYYSIRYWLDDHCLTRYSGALWRTRRVIPLRQITSLTVRQGPMGRALRFGDVSVFTASSGGDGAPEEKLAGIPDPHKLRRDILSRLYRIDAAPQIAAPNPPNAATAAMEPDKLNAPERSAPAPDSVEALLRGIRGTLERIEAKLDPLPSRDGGTERQT
jgi:membrane protein YdbS with pleckstrin-like domain